MKSWIDFFKHLLELYFLFLIYLDMETLKTLKVRKESGDKVAKEFLSKIQSSIVVSPPKIKGPVTYL